MQSLSFNCCSGASYWAGRYWPGLRLEVARVAHLAGEGELKSGLGGEQIESNHRLMYTSEWASPQKCRAPLVFAASELQR